MRRMQYGRAEPPARISQGLGAFVSTEATWATEVVNSSVVTPRPIHVRWARDEQRGHFSRSTHGHEAYPLAL